MSDLLCHLVWMPEYRGEDDIEAGGFAYVAETGTAHESRNFEKDSETGLVYGYVQTRSGTINISRLGAKDGQDHVEGVRVIFTATEPKTKNRYVVGYYVNATVFRTRQDGLRSVPGMPGAMINHSIEVDAENAILIPLTERTLTVPHHDGKGLPGQTIVFYPGESERLEMQNFLSSFNQFVATTPTRRARPASKGSGWPSSPNIERNRRVEQAAVDAVRDYFGQLGADRQDDNCGWDLEFEVSGERFCVEVKGVSGSEPQAAVSVNEYRAIQRVMEGKFDEGIYRLAIVTNALGNRKLHLFGHDRGNRWVCALTGEVIEAIERVAAQFA